MTKRDDMPALPDDYTWRQGYGLYTPDQLHAYAFQYAEQRVREEREACIEACRAEHLEDPQDREDDAYDCGVSDCIAALRKRLG